MRGLLVMAVAAAAAHQAAAQASCGYSICGGEDKTCTSTDQVGSTCFADCTGECAVDCSGSANCMCTPNQSCVPVNMLGVVIGCSIGGCCLIVICCIVYSKQRHNAARNRQAGVYVPIVQHNNAPNYVSHPPIPRSFAPSLAPSLAHTHFPSFDRATIWVSFSHSRAPRVVFPLCSLTARS